MENFKLIIVEDVPLELKGTEGIVRNEIPEAEVIGTADNERRKSLALLTMKPLTGDLSSNSNPTSSCLTSVWVALQR